MKRLTCTLLAWVLAAAASAVSAHAVFQGTWGAGGHYVGSPLLYKFVAPSDPAASNPHPARAWTAGEATVLRRSFAEWDAVLCDICFQEIDTEAILGTITLRWEDSDFFGGVLAGGENYVAWSHVYGSDDYDFGPDYPQGEIYFNLAMKWFVDADPTTDEAIPADEWDLLTVATHEIGHMLGLLHQEQDYFTAHPGYVPGVMDNRSLAGGGWFEGARRHVTNADWEALRDLGYAVHVAEPQVLALLGLALVLLALQRRTAARDV